ncbi:hypothetical protein SKAU_G00366560 [Synaphobranchus kaupii]|uniref:Uncharacterized protein n=1 Tax=Synaphobranchus kaupii TaxID=118154 RepID=A0A9Q1EF72_SYNKA|nr:hypothetical protein SKAU_G00366550 [Synaphobranchus kaupii]KAJ8337690.1 hypothetical protein SKAU_G00366560 [Synaphobranchus kaupii]
MMFVPHFVLHNTEVPNTKSNAVKQRHVAQEGGSRPLAAQRRHGDSGAESPFDYRWQAVGMCAAVPLLSCRIHGNGASPEKGASTTEHTSHLRNQSMLGCHGIPQIRAASEQDARGSMKFEKKPFS